MIETATAIETVAVTVIVTVTIATETATATAGVIEIIVIVIEIETIETGTEIVIETATEIEIDDEADAIAIARLPPTLIARADGAAGRSDRSIVTLIATGSRHPPPSATRLTTNLLKTRRIARAAGIPLSPLVRPRASRLAPAIRRDTHCERWLAASLVSPLAAINPLLLQQQVLARIQQQEQAKAAASAIDFMCRIYVGSLDYEITEKQLEETFIRFGPIRSISMNRVRGRSTHQGVLIAYTLQTPTWHTGLCLHPIHHARSCQYGDGHHERCDAWFEVWQPSLSLARLRTDLGPTTGLCVSLDLIPSAPRWLPAFRVLLLHPLHQSTQWQQPQQQPPPPPPQQPASHRESRS